MESGETGTEYELPLPVIPYVRVISLFLRLTHNLFQWKCRQIMTRADFMEGLDVCTQ
jgi:hypothetical protein